MKKNLTLIIAIVVLIVGVTYAYLNRPKAEIEPVPSKDRLTLKLAYLPTIKELDLLITSAERAGIFEKNNLNVEKTEATKNVAPLIASNQADVTVGSIVSNYQAYLSGQDISLVSLVYDNPVVSGLASKLDKENLNQIKTVGVISVGGPDQIHFSAIAKKYNLDLKSIKYVVAPTDQAKISLIKSGEIDAAIVDPNSTVDFPEIKTILSSELYQDVFLPIGIVASPGTQQEKTEALKLFVKAIQETQKYQNDNKDFMTSLIKDKYQAKDSGAETYYDQLKRANGSHADTGSSKLKDFDLFIRSITKEIKEGRTLEGFIKTL